MHHNIHVLIVESCLMDMSVKIVIIQKTDKMKTIIELVGMIITLPFLALEAMIKGVMCILYFPLILSIAIIYPLIKRKDLSWTEKWWKYSTTWEKGFYSGNIYRLWEVED